MFGDDSQVLKATISQSFFDRILISAYHKVVTKDRIEGRKDKYKNKKHQSHEHRLSFALINIEIFSV